MATLNGVEIAPCERCHEPLGAREYEVTKGSAQVRRLFCDSCAEKTAEVYPVKPIGRQSARPPKDEKPPAAPSTSDQQEEA